MEGEVLLVQEDRGMVVFGTRFFEFGQGGVGAADVGGVVLAVVQLIDLARDVRLQRSVIPVQVRQGVISHGVPFLRSLSTCVWCSGDTPHAAQSSCGGKAESTSLHDRVYQNNSCAGRGGAGFVRSWVRAGRLRSGTSAAPARSGRRGYRPADSRGSRSMNHDASS